MHLGTETPGRGTRIPVRRPDSGPGMLLVQKLGDRETVPDHDLLRAIIHPQRRHRGGRVILALELVVPGHIERYDLVTEFDLKGPQQQPAAQRPAGISLVAHDQVIVHGDTVTGEKMHHNKAAQSIL